MSAQTLMVLGGLALVGVFSVWRAGDWHAPDQTDLFDLISREVA